MSPARSEIRRTGWVLLGALVALVFSWEAAQGQSTTVTTMAELRAAIANPSISTINIVPGTYLLTSSGSGELRISRNLTIQNTGGGRVVIDANGASRVFRVDNVVVTFTGLTIRGGAGQDGAGIRNDGTLTVVQSTISGNNAGGSDGGGIINRQTLTLRNSTVSGNTVTTGGQGGGILNDGVQLTLINSTISHNSAPSGSGGGIMRSGGTLTLRNTIVANNTGGQIGGTGGSLVSNGRNVVQGGCTGCAPTDLTGDPLLGPLQDNGGNSFTRALGVGSPAIDYALAADAPATDQRGIARPQGPASDVGAFEVQVLPSVTVTPDNGQNLRHLPSGPTYSFTFTVTNGTGAGSQSFDLLASKTGAAITIISVNGVAGDSTRITNLAAGASQNIAVVYSIGDVPAGTVDTLRLRARSVTAPAVFDDGSADLQVVRPTISSAANQNFPVGDPPQPIGTITITESTVASITAANDIRIRIPAGLTMTWDTADLSAVIGGAAASKVSSTVSYEDGGKTLVLDVTSNFVAGDQITVSGLSFASFTTTSGPARLELEVRNDDTVMATDDKTITVIAAGVPRISSEFDQSFRVGDAPTTISTITVTDDAVTRSITAVNDIRIRIPAGFNMSWDVTDVSALILGTAAGKVSSTVSYEDGGKTLVIDVLTDFAPNDVITISGLSFRNFTAASPDDNLELEVRNDGAVSAEDDKVVFIVFIAVTPNLSSAADQSFTVGDPVTEMVTLRVTDDPFPQITAANDIRIRIPVGLDMIWDTTDVSPQLSGRARNKVSSTVTYEDGGKTLVIDVLTNFAADDWLNVKGLSFMNFTSASFARRLELEVYNDGVANTSDTRTKTIFGPTYDVAVVPDTQRASRLPSNGTNYTVDFTVANIGSISDSYDLLTVKLPGGTITVISITGPGVTQGANPDSARLANLGQGLTATVTVTYAVASVPAGTTDTLVLTARSVGAPSKADDARLELVVVRPNLTIGKTVTPGGTPLPGTDLSYTITVTNAGSEAAVSVVHVDSLPAQVGFKVGSVATTLPPGVGVTVSYSNDGAASWTYTPVDAGCSAPAGYDDCVTHIRWALQDPLSHIAPDDTGQFEFVARVR